MDKKINIFKRWQFYSYPQMYQIPKCKHVLREKNTPTDFPSVTCLIKQNLELFSSPTDKQLLSEEAVTTWKH